jgi:hypothetical protein
MVPSWADSDLGLMDSICPTIGGRSTDLCTELIHSANENVGYSHSPPPTRPYRSVREESNKLVLFGSVACIYVNSEDLTVTLW